MKHKSWLSFLLVLCILMGCSQPKTNTDLVGNDRDTLGLAPDFSYEVAKQTPNILVNQIGYLTDNNKVAILRGNNLHDVFYVYDAYNNEKVFEGYLISDNIGVTQSDNASETIESEEQKNIYLADFSQIKRNGTYYVYQKDLGYSYQFEIGDNIYDSVEETALTLLETEDEDVSKICYQLTALLITKELYPDHLLEAERLDKICTEKIEMLLQAQDTVTGNVYADISDINEIQELDEQQKQQYISLAATAEFAGVLAIYANQIKATDRTLAYQYQQAAEKAYKAIQLSLDNVGYDAGYFAASHLYRLTGRLKYAQAIEQYLNMKEEQKGYTEYDFSLFADYGYLTLRYGSNLAWSELVMKRIMKQAEEISRTVGKNNYYVSEKREYNDINGKLKDMSNLALVNYIITNHEYSTLQKNYLDYFLGRNPYNICYVDGFGTGNAIDDEEKINSENIGLFYLLLQSTKL